MSRPLDIRLVKRVVVAAGLGLLISLVFAWAVERVPVLAWIVGLGSIAVIAWSVHAILRSAKPVRSLAVTAAAMALAASGGAAIDAVIGTDGEIPTAAQEAAPSTTGNAASPTVAVAATVHSTEPATPPTTPPTTPATTPATTPPTTGQGAIVELRSVGDATSSTIELISDGAVMGEVWLFSTAHPGQPVVINHGLSGVEVVSAPSGVEVVLSAETAAVTVEVVGVGDAWSAVRQGVRTPAIGHVHSDGVVDHSGLGANAAAIEALTAELQRAVPALTDPTRGYVLSLMGRQLTPGTFTMTQSALDGQGPEVAIVFTADAPRFSQSLLGDPANGLWSTASGVVSCSGGTCITLTDATFPLDAALAVVNGLADFEIVGRDGGSFNGQPTTCVDVVRSPAGGPTPGTTCWLADGRPSLLERPSNGDRLVLTSAIPVPAADRLDPPE